MPLQRDIKMTQLVKPTRCENDLCICGAAKSKFVLIINKLFMRDKSKKKMVLDSEN